VPGNLYSLYDATDAISSSNNFTIFEYPVKLMFRRYSFIESSCIQLVSAMQWNLGVSRNLARHITDDEQQ